MSGKMARGCDLGFRWLVCKPASKPVGHTRHSRHADHTVRKPKVTAMRADLSGTLGHTPIIKNRPSTDPG